MNQAAELAIKHLSGYYAVATRQFWIDWNEILITCCCLLPLSIALIWFATRSMRRHDLDDELGWLLIVIFSYIGSTIGLVTFIGLSLWCITAAINPEYHIINIAAWPFVYHGK